MNAPAEEVQYEPVYTVMEFHDFPLEGVASFKGRPHCYRLYRGRVFKLWPIDEQAFQLVLESWQIYVRWDRALQAGQVSEDDDDEKAPPALPEDLERYQELQQLLRGKLAESTDVTVAHADFRQLEPWQDGRGWVRLDVAWRPVPASQA